MPPTLGESRKRYVRDYGSTLAGLLIVLCALTAVANCRTSTEEISQRSARVERGARSPVVVLGNLSGSAPPSETESRLAEFFFGETPEPALGLVKPSAVAQIDGDVWVCDSALRTIFKFDSRRGTMSPVTFRPVLQKPVSIDVLDNGDRLVVDLGVPAAIRFDASGHERVRYFIEGNEFRPADAVQVGDAVWVTNTALHRIDVFGATAGEYRHSIGHRGSGPSEFGVPLGMAVTPSGTVLVVDMLNDRVQELNSDGSWRRFIGRPGDQTGCFGRPKDVAVSEDGTIFVVDAATQRIHAFDAAGRPLASFGGGDESGTPLSVPGGIAVSLQNPMNGTPAATAGEVRSYVLVAEQIRAQGVRVYGWLGARGEDSKVATLAAGHFVKPKVENPHWNPARCSACHGDESATPTRIPAERVDALCLSCHDGVQAAAEAHPIGRIAKSDHVSTPADWPLVGGRIGCATCHNVMAHCDSSGQEDRSNRLLLRGERIGGSVQFCTQCHEGSDRWRISPHAQMADAGGVRAETCNFCHVKMPEIPADGRRPGHPELRVSGSNVCLGCHTRHWDYFPEGHTDQPLTDEIARRLAAREAADGDETAALTGDLPLADGRVACFTCHNPHQAGVFPAGSQMDRRATSEADAKRLLRRDRTDLCQTCHSK